MMRQLGGSFGISIINTYFARRVVVHRTDLISHIATANPDLTERLNTYISYFQSKGTGLQDAHQKAMKLIDLTIVKQSAMLSYLDAFLLIGLLFLLALPLLLFVMNRSKKHAANIIISDH